MTYSPSDRINSIGASDLPILLGLSPYASATPWSIVHRVQRPDTPEQALGRGLETWLVERIGCSAASSEVFRREGWAHATPDGLIWGGCVCESWSTGCKCPPAVVIEAKSVSRFMCRDWGDGVPPYVYAQVQWQMWVTGALRGVVSALVAGEYQKHDLERDENFIKKAVSVAHEFWAGLQLGQDPPLDASRACGAALRARLAPVAEAEPIPATAFQESEWASIQEFRASAKSFEEEARLRAAGLLQSMPGPLLLQGGLELRSTSQGLRTRKAPRA